MDGAKCAVMPRGSLEDDAHLRRQRTSCADHGCPRWQFVPPRARGPAPSYKWIRTMARPVSATGRPPPTATELGFVEAGGVPEQLQVTECVRGPLATEHAGTLGHLPHTGEKLCDRAKAGNERMEERRLAVHVPRRSEYCREAEAHRPRSPTSLRVRRRELVHGPGRRTPARSTSPACVLPRPRASAASTRARRDEVRLGAGKRHRRRSILAPDRLARRRRTDGWPEKCSLRRGLWAGGLALEAQLDYKNACDRTTATTAVRGSSRMRRVVRWAAVVGRLPRPCLRGRMIRRSEMPRHAFKRGWRA